jgi:hypothetical protein
MKNEPIGGITKRLVTGENADQRYPCRIDGGQRGDRVVSSVKTKQRKNALVDKFFCIGSCNVCFTSIIQHFEPDCAAIDAARLIYGVECQARASEVVIADGGFRPRERRLDAQQDRSSINACLRVRSWQSGT